MFYFLKQKKHPFLFFFLHVSYISFSCKSVASAREQSNKMTVSWHLQTPFQAEDSCIAIALTDDRVQKGQTYSHSLLHHPEVRDSAFVL